MVSRAAWGADKCRPRAKPSYGTVRAAYVHHTVSLNDYTPEEAPGIVLAICRYHRNSNGWNDIGYQALVDKYGVLYEGRAGGLDKPVLGAHAQGYNAQATGIASIGDNTAVGLSDTALDSLADYIRWKLDDPRAAAHRVHHAHERRRRHQPLPGRPPRARPARARAPRHQQHRLPGLGALLPAGRPAQPRGHRRGAARSGHLPDRLAVQDEHALRRVGHAQRRAHRRHAHAARGEAGAGGGAPRDPLAAARPADHGRVGRLEHARAAAQDAPAARHLLRGRRLAAELQPRAAAAAEAARGARPRGHHRRARAAGAARGHRHAAQAAGLPGAPAAHPRLLPAGRREDGARARRALPQLVRAGLRRAATACTCWRATRRGHVAAAGSSRELALAGCARVTPTPASAIPSRARGR